MSSSSCIHFIPRVAKDLSIAGKPTEKLTVVIRTAADTISLLRGAAPKSVHRLNIIAKNVKGDIGLRYANTVAEKVRVWIECLDGDVDLPRTSFLQPLHQLPTKDWLRFHIGPFKDLKETVKVKESYENIMERLTACSDQFREELEERNLENKTIDIPSSQNAYFVDLAEDDIHIMHRYEKGQIPELDLYIGKAYKGIRVN